MSLKIHVIKKLGDFNLKIDLDVEDHIIGLLGYSGCGKTMTLKMIAGIVTPDSGSIVLNGRTLFDSKQKINLSVQERNIGLMFQSYALFNHMTVYENILVGMKGHDKKGQEEVIKNYLKLLEIENLKDKKPKMLSGGQKQRVALARILAQKPEILMLDEPFSALDSHLRFMIEEPFKKALQSFKGTVLYVSHNRQEIYKYCDQTAVMADGQIQEIKGTEDLFMKCETVAAARLTGCRNMSKVKWLNEEEVHLIDWGITLKLKKEKQTYIKSSYDTIGMREGDMVLTSDLKSDEVMAVEVGKLFKMPDKIKIDLWTSNGYKLIYTCSSREYHEIETLLNQKHIGVIIDETKLLYLRSK